MKKKQTIIILSIGALLTATAMTYTVKYNQIKKTSEEKIRELDIAILDINNQSTNNINKIRESYLNEIKLLKGELKKARSTSTVYQIQSKYTSSNEVQKYSHSDSFKDRMDRLKEEDPEKFKKMMDDRRNKYSAIEYNAAERTAMLMNEVDTANMNDEELQNHDQLVEKMGQIFRLTQELNTTEIGADREVWQKLGPLMREVRPMMDMERQVILKQSFSKYLDLSTSEAQELTEHIEEVIKYTTIQPGRHRPIRNQ